MKYYPNFEEKVRIVRQALGHPLTLSEKILYSHLFDWDAGERWNGATGDWQGCGSVVRPLHRLADYGDFRPDRVALQDATGQMALLQFMNAGKEKVCTPASVHCDHLICASDGADNDLFAAREANMEVYDFLSSASSRYGIDFWQPGAGIIHQIVLENYAFPGGMMVGTDSHTPNAGGLSMLAIGVGGADAVDVLTGMPWELLMPRIIGVELTGSLSGWASPKDVILKLAGMLTVKGGTNSILEYFGPGVGTISCTGRATICNMGAEVGATSSIFPFDGNSAKYLSATGRQDVAETASAYADDLRADPEVVRAPSRYFDEVLHINLSQMEPYVNGPFTPDVACPVSDMKRRIQENGFPDRIEVSLVGSCTNSSYGDLSRAASVAETAMKAGLKPKASLVINPGSEMIRATAERDGILDTFRRAGATIMANACGPCIGQWRRKVTDNAAKNSIVTTFNRNFAKRADGNPNTNAFLVSPEMAIALAFAGSLSFNPLADSFDGFRFPEPQGNDFPEGGFIGHGSGRIFPKPGSPEPLISPESERLQKLKPFEKWDGKDFISLPLLIKVKGKCTTDHISMAGPWLKYRGHLEHISENLLIGATDAFTGKSGPVAPLARKLHSSVVVAEDNYGEGSSREHAAMEPRFLGVKAIIAKSFARIHETNLKKQGVLALTFSCPSDYEKVRHGDKFDILCSGLTAGTPVKVVLHHEDGTSEEIETKHSYNSVQIGWFKAGSALNSLKENE